MDFAPIPLHSQIQFWNALRKDRTNWVVRFFPVFVWQPKGPRFASESLDADTCMGQSKLTQYHEPKGLSGNMPKKLFMNLDPWSLLVVILTFILFLTALFIKGLTHDMLLEAGVFLVSVKLIIMSHKQAAHTEMMEHRLDEIYQAVGPDKATRRADLSS